MEAARLERRTARAWSWPALHSSPQLVVYVLLLAIIANMVLAPLAMVLATALNLGATAHTPVFSLDFFKQAWTSPTTWGVLGNTAIFAICSTLLAMIIGVFFAFTVERTDMPMKNFA